MTAIRLLVAAAPADGRGHVSRAIAVAEALAAQGAVAALTFLRGSPSAAEQRRLRDLGVGTGGPVDGELVVVDLPDPNEATGRASPGRTVVFDDREAFRGAATLVVQPSMPSWSGPAQTERVLAGYGWAPIARRWQAAIPMTAPIRPSGRRLLVSFGGSDPARVTERIAPALAAVADWDVTIVVGHDYRGDAPSQAAVVRDPEDLAERVAQADVVVLGSGTMKFEVAALGRPMLLLAVADDQLPVGPAFAATGAAAFLGDGRSLASDAVVRAVAALFDDPVRRATMAARARDVVDGRGGDRLARELIEAAGAAGHGRIA